MVTGINLHVYNAAIALQSFIGQVQQVQPVPAISLKIFGFKNFLQFKRESLGKGLKDVQRNLSRTLATKHFTAVINSKLACLSISATTTPVRKAGD
jgi:hypothetical protein